MKEWGHMGRVLGGGNDRNTVLMKFSKKKQKYIKNELGFRECEGTVGGNGM